MVTHLVTLALDCVGQPRESIEGFRMQTTIKRLIAGVALALSTTAMAGMALRPLSQPAPSYLQTPTHSLSADSRPMQVDGSVGGDRTSDGKRPCVLCSGDIRGSRGLLQSALEETSRRIWP